MKRAVGTVLACLLAIALAFGNDDNAGVPKDEHKTRSAQATTQAINARLERVEKAMEAQQEQIEQLRQQLQVPMGTPPFPWFATKCPI
jgi:phosphopantetheine adenylyltransferase